MDYRKDIEDAKSARLESRRQEARRLRPARMTTEQFKDLKKTLGAEHTIKGWENRHVDRGGNFGYTVAKGGKWFTVLGTYDGQGRVQELKVVTYGGTGFQDIDKSKTFSEATEIIRKYIEGH
jgi:hypothetical protein